MTFSAPGALGAVPCPVDGCRRRYSGRELIRHLNTAHPRVELSEAQRDSVRVKQLRILHQLRCEVERA
jgi:hypothetical protein